MGNKNIVTSSFKPSFKPFPDITNTHYLCFPHAWLSHSPRHAQSPPVAVRMGIWRLAEATESHRLDTVLGHFRFSWEAGGIEDTLRSKVSDAVHSHHVNVTHVKKSLQVICGKV